MSIVPGPIKPMAQSEKILMNNVHVVKVEEGTEVNESKEQTTENDQKDSSLSFLIRDRCCFKVPENPQMVLIVWVSRALPLIAGFGSVFFIIWLLSTPENWETNSDATDAEVLDRESSRGLFVSVVIAILMNIIGALMFYIRVSESLVVTNYGFILGPVIGYLLDQGVGTDAGFRHFMQTEGFGFTFASLIDGNFVRYIVTVLLDLFISNPLQDVLKQQVKKIGVIDSLKDQHGKSPLLIKYDGFVLLNFPSILQSIIAFITFNAYTNQTRFAWAYASSTLDRELRISPGTMMLCGALAGILFLNFYTIMDYISEREYFDVNTKLMYTLVMLGLLYGLNATDSIEAPIHGEEDESYTDWLGTSKPFVGFIVFILFLIYGLVYPLYTRLGCCGRFKPASADDHMMDEIDASELTNVQQVGRKVSDEVLDKIEEILKMSSGIDISQARKMFEKTNNKGKKSRRNARR